MTQRATTPYFQGQASVLKYGIWDLKFICEAGSEITGK
jgi:hypothetical protein